jgi:hypothetical protein
LSGGPVGVGYLYGITEAEAELPAAMPGIDGGPIEAIVVGRLAAIVTRVSRNKIRAQRSNLLAHHKLLGELVRQRIVLPCAFGTVAADEEQVCNLLRANQDELLDRLALLDGKVEMSLSVYWNTSNIFEFFVTNNQELKEMRDRVFRPSREPSMEEQLELGKMFESLLQQCRECHTKQVIEALSPYCAEIRSIDVGTEQMIMKLVCLLAKEDQCRFEAGIQAVAQKYDDHYTFKYSGPWIPYYFVDVKLGIED